MTNAELASALNDEFGLEGRVRLSANVIRQWVEWGLLPKAQVAGRVERGGPIWERNVNAMIRARRFAEMRAFGIRSERALVAQAYLEWRAVPFDRAKAAIIGEFGSAHAKLWRTLTATIPDGPAANFSVTKRRALTTQGGPLDPIFRGTQFQISELAMLSAMQSARGSTADITEQSAQIGAAIAKMVPSVAGLLDGHWLLTYAIPTGLFAPFDEIEFSGASALETADQTKFEQAQKSLSKFVRRLRRFADGQYAAVLPGDIEPLQFMLRTLSQQITSGPWLVAGFIQILMTQNRENMAY